MLESRSLMFYSTALNPKLMSYSSLWVQERRAVSFSELIKHTVPRPHTHSFFFPPLSLHARLVHVTSPTSITSVGRASRLARGHWAPQQEVAFKPCRSTGPEVSSQCEC